MAVEVAAVELKNADGRTESNGAPLRQRAR